MSDNGGKVRRQSRSSHSTREGKEMKRHRYVSLNNINQRVASKGEMEEILAHEFSRTFLC